MTCETQGEAGLGAEFQGWEGQGALWSLPGGERLPDDMNGAPLVLGDPTHPARLRPSDLDNPDGFHARLNHWLLQQG
jgi:hypothetical protein